MLSSISNQVKHPLRFGNRGLVGVIRRRGEIRVAGGLAGLENGHSGSRCASGNRRRFPSCANATSSHRQREIPTLARRDPFSRNLPQPRLRLHISLDYVSSVFTTENALQPS